MEKWMENLIGKIYDDLPSLDVAFFFYLFCACWRFQLDGQIANGKMNIQNTAQHSPHMKSKMTF